MSHVFDYYFIRESSTKMVLQWTVTVCALPVLEPVQEFVVSDSSVAYILHEFYLLVASVGKLAQGRGLFHR